MPDPEAVVVGGGPAGLCAGLQLARAGYRTVLIGKDRLGGQARFLGKIENYPGFPSGVDGGVLMDRFIRQARRWGLRTVRAEVRTVAWGRSGFKLELTGRRRLWTRAVVFCPGAVSRNLDLAAARRLWGRGVHNAAFDDAARWRGRDVAVAGGGEAAAHQALALARHARRVYLVCRGDGLKAHRLLQQRLRRCPRLVKVMGARVRALRGARQLEAMQLEGRRGRIWLRVGALFVLVGKKPAVRPWPKGRTPSGFFVAGDASGDVPRQVVIAAGEGMKAAMRCMAFLEGRPEPA
ncbi:MAG: NAD(P)/FAD-dependent oxidoreductase [Elusimicrobiota bacterium]|jgi:thioredoxin reductase (NADPH)